MEETMSTQLTELVRRAYRGEVAHRHVVAISQHHRIQASPGYRAAAAYVADQLAQAGLTVVTHRYPANFDARFWTSPSFQEWSCNAATLQLLDADGQPVETLCDFAAVATSVIQRSIPVKNDFDIVLLTGKGGLAEADFAGLDVAGKLVLTDQAPGRVLELAVRQHGAAGILFDGMTAGGRSDLDLPDARQYTSFWWTAAHTPDCFGFVLSPRQGRRLRGQLTAGHALRVRAHIDASLYNGEMEVVDACIRDRDATVPGAAHEEILLVAHLCHPRPGAHDNGSGSAALIEAASTLARLVADGSLPATRRGIRFLWIPEMTGTYAWLADHQIGVEAGRWIAGLNLDMVGADQNATGSVWQLVDVPQAAASFADHLLAWLREPFLIGQRYEETPFSAGSDHYILSDPTVGIPTPMLIQWPDTFYHTSADTPDKVSPDSLARSGALAAVYAYWLATAGPAETRWLAHWMLTRFGIAAGKAAAAAAEKIAATQDDTERSRTLAEYRRQSAFAADRLSVALGSLTRIDSSIAEELAALRSQVVAIAGREGGWVENAVRSLGPVTADASNLVTAPAPVAEVNDAVSYAEAATLIPRRVLPGPIDMNLTMQTQPAEVRAAFRTLTETSSSDLAEGGALLQYWADGRRTVADIAGLVGLETGHHPGASALAFFKVLAQAGLVELTHK
jgi:aminopeptidase YwaD